MAKKAKRRGRPPGSKNKTSLGKSVATFDIAQLRAHIDRLQSVLSKKINEQRAHLERQLTALGGYTSRTAPSAPAAKGSQGRTTKRAPAKPKYRSKASPKLTWSGRGMAAGWLKDEMKATGKPKEFFLIKA
jgi:DNA-binding protein H-NS